MSPLRKAARATPWRRVCRGRREDYTRVYLSHSRESSQVIHTHSHTIRTLFAQLSHRIHSYSHTIRTLFARSHTIRTLFARSHTIRTVSHYSHTIRTVAHYSHSRTHYLHTILLTFANYSRDSHTIRAIVTPHSHTIRTSSHPGHTIHAVGAGPFTVFALIHALFAQLIHTRSHLCICDLYTLV